MSNAPAVQRNPSHSGRLMWVLLAALIVLVIAGLIGRRLTIKGHAKTQDGALSVQYERIERTHAPSVVDIQLGAAALHDGRFQLWINQRTVSRFASEPFSPKPLSSTVSEDGMIYTFPVANEGASVRLILDSTSPGTFPLEVRIPGSQMLTMKVAVLP